MRSFAWEPSKVRMDSCYPQDRRGPGDSQIDGEDHYLSPAINGFADPIRLSPNTALGRYLILRDLGQGRSGSVYLARDTITGTDVAVKLALVSAGATHGADLLAQEKAAFDAVQDHHHVLKVFDLHRAELGAAAFMVLAMEFADGGTLRHWLNARRDQPSVRVQRGLVYFRQICRGIAALHEVGRCHHDLRPENILFVQGVCKIADLGTAAITSRCAVDTSPYTSPEQLTARCADDVDHRADVYALGAILHELLHPRASLPFARRATQLGGPANTAAPLPHAAGSLRQVAHRCLKRDPAERYASVAELLHVLDGQLEEPWASASARRLSEWWRTACACIPTHRWACAARLCDRILEADAHHEHARSLRHDLQSRAHAAERLYAAIERELDRLSLGELTELLRGAVALYPDHPSGRAVQLRLRARARAFQAYMTRGVEAFDARVWEEARAWFQNAARLDPHSTSAARALRLTDAAARHRRNPHRAHDVSEDEGDPR